MRSSSSIQPGECSTNSQVYQWHSCSRWAICLYSMACLVFSAGCLFAFAISSGEELEGNRIALVLGVAFGLCAVALSIQVRTIVDQVQRKVTRESMLLGRFVMFRRSFKFDDFKTVLTRCTGDEEGASDTWFVGLRRKSGRRLWIRYWNVPRKSACNEAEWLAERLAGEIGVSVER